MAEEPFSPRRSEWLSQLCEGSLSSAEREELQAQLLADPDLRRVYRDYLAVEASLQWWALTRQPTDGESEPLPASVTPASAVLPDSQASARHEAHGSTAAIALAWLRSNAQSVNRPQVFSAIFAVAFLFLVLTLAAMWRISQPHRQAETWRALASSPTQQPLAQIIETPNCVWARRPATDAFYSAQEEVELGAGLARLRFRSGAEVELVGPTRFRVDSSLSGALEQGSLIATVPTRASGFTIRTAGMDIVDLGTEFSVVVDEAKRTAVCVHSGKLRLHSRGNERTIREIAAGETAQVDAAGAFQPLASHMLKRLAAARAPQTLEASLWQDAGLLIYYGPSSAEETTVKNLSRSGSAYDGRLLGGQWREAEDAPLPRALHFENVADGIAFNAPDVLPAFTLVARLRLDDAALRQPLMGLVMSYGWRNVPGPVHWQIQNAKTICFSISGHPTQYHVELSASQLIGRWVHLAVTCDQARGRIVHYVDAQQVDEQRDLLLPAAQVGKAWIGNWNPAGYPYPGPQRNLNGELAEFMLFRRALSAEQIDYLYRGGKAPPLAPDSNEPNLRSTTNPPELEPTRLVK